MNLFARFKERSRGAPRRRGAPFFAMLERRGVSYAELEHAIGAEALPRAMNRCTDCGARYYCRWLDAACPNGELFTSARRKRAIPAA